MYQKQDDAVSWPRACAATESARPVLDLVSLVGARSKFQSARPSFLQRQASSVSWETRREKLLDAVQLRDNEARGSRARACGSRSPSAALLDLPAVQYHHGQEMKTEPQMYA